MKTASDTGMTDEFELLRMRLEPTEDAIRNCHDVLQEDHRMSAAEIEIAEREALLADI